MVMTSEIGNVRYLCYIMCRYVLWKIESKIIIRTIVRGRGDIILL